MVVHRQTGLMSDGVLIGWSNSMPFADLRGPAFVHFQKEKIRWFDKSRAHNLCVITMENTNWILFGVKSLWKKLYDTVSCFIVFTTEALGHVKNPSWCFPREGANTAPLPITKINEILMLFLTVAYYCFPGLKLRNIALFYWFPSLSGAAFPSRGLSCFTESLDQGHVQEQSILTVGPAGILQVLPKKISLPVYPWPWGKHEHEINMHNIALDKAAGQEAFCTV